MKKLFSILAILLLVVTITGCGKSKDNEVKKDASYEELLDLYVEAFEKADIELLIKALPEFMAPFVRQEISNEDIKDINEYYGDNVKYSFNITGKTKMSDEWLKENNAIIKNEFHSNMQADECYALEGTTEIKGSKNSITNKIEELWYCNFDGTWRLMVG